MTTRTHDTLWTPEEDAIRRRLDAAASLEYAALAQLGRPDLDERRRSILEELARWARNERRAASDAIETAGRLRAELDNAGGFEPAV